MLIQKKLSSYFIDICDFIDHRSSSNRVTEKKEKAKIK
jgi:hypothetical protein